MNDIRGEESLLLESENARITDCCLCTRLVDWRETVARERKRAYQDQTYWGRPAPHFGDPFADRLIVGLAPAAHGANRTGRMFTGDRSGDWLYGALFRAGVANQPNSDSRDDGMMLQGVLITAAVHCAPPGNKPTPQEIANCAPYLERLWNSRDWKAVLCLGSLAWNQFHKTIGTKPPAFGHGTSYRSANGTLLVASYHPSQQNTFTGKLTQTMFDAAIAQFLERSGA